MFCFHKWKVDNYNFTPPNDRIKSFKNASEFFVRSVFEGVTNLYLRCDKCGDIKTETVFGQYKPKE